ncbi:hypothetical protein BTS2_2452 [Bacillus sp. TS-2]|nr:hypothetical protein BTS2_2452 [Bacillus sp. TS-2]
MKQNVGIVDALIRITIGLVILTWSVSKGCSKHSKGFPLLSSLIGAMKVAEGITKFCPIIYIAEKRSIQTHTHPNDEFNPS